MDKELKRLLRKLASAHYMCEENRSALGACETKEQLVSLYKKTIDWALEENYPGIEILRRHFSDCEGLGIFIDKEFHDELLNEHQVYVFHNCSGTARTGLNVPKRLIPMMYFADGCHMKLTGEPNAVGDIRVPIYVFGENTVQTVPSEDVVFKTYKFETKK